MSDERPQAWVTGARGFLGRHVGQALAKRGYEVTGFVRNPDLNAELITSWGFRDIQTGLFEGGVLKQALKRSGPPAIVFHGIGSGSVAQADSDAAADDSRTTRTVTLLTEELSRNAPGVRLIYPSSAAVYGAAAPGPIDEKAPTKPISAYGANKLVAESICLDFVRRGEGSATIVRFFSVYGPPQRKLLLWDIGQRILAGERKIMLGGTGEETRDFLYITDAAKIIATLAAAATPPMFVNAGSGEPTMVRDVVRMLATALDVDAEFHFSGLLRPGNPLHQHASVSRLTDLGFAPTTPLVTGIGAYAKWLREVRA
jgi:UDP-glucose 4-epimerase